MAGKLVVFEIEIVSGHVLLLSLSFILSLSPWTSTLNSIGNPVETAFVVQFTAFAAIYYITANAVYYITNAGGFISKVKQHKAILSWGTYIMCMYQMLALALSINVSNGCWHDNNDNVVKYRFHWLFAKY